MTNELMNEAAKLRRVPGIVYADGPAGRRARVAGSGIEVFEIMRTYHQVDHDLKRLKISFDWLTDEQLGAALAYYREFPEEIDNWLEVEAAESPEAFWQRHPFTRPPWR